MSVRHRIVGNEDGSKNITVFLNGNLLVTDNKNPRFDEIVERINEGELDGLEALFEPEAAIQSIFAQLTSDVVINDGTVEYRGKPVNEALSNHIVKLWDAGEEFAPVVRFLERLQNNPNEDSVERLWSWISDRHLRLTNDGRIIGYKGLTSDRKSKRSGYGDIRNGLPVTGQIPHEPGDVIEKARDQVVFDVNIGCAEGLHVGDYSYASWYGDVVVEVEVDPADVVSVPNDDSRKMRVCRYTVRDIVKEESKTFYSDGWGTNIVKASDSYVTINTFDGRLIGDAEAQSERVLDILAKARKSREDIKTLTVNVHNNPVDTRKNHLRQQRDANGRFIKKGK